MTASGKATTTNSQGGQQLLSSSDNIILPSSFPQQQPIPLIMDGPEHHQQQQQTNNDTISGIVSDTFYSSYHEPFRDGSSRSTGGRIPYSSSNYNNSSNNNDNNIIISSNSHPFPSFFQQQQQQHPSTIRKKTRLLSIAKYESFYPQALACSSPFYMDSLSSSSPYEQQQQQQQQQAPNYNTNNNHNLTCLGAVAGPHGVAIFRVSKPYSPLMILSHTTTTTTRAPSSSSSPVTSTTSTLSSSSSAVTSLCFQPTTTTTTTNHHTNNMLYLASARGSGILLWDVSGHSLSPLWGRLGVESIHTSNELLSINSITSLAWKHQSSCLAATTSRLACLWDIRTPHQQRQQSQSSSSSLSYSSVLVKPNLRFAVMDPSINTTNNNNNNNNRSSSPRLLQIAFSTMNHECAILDCAGIVRIYDTRMTNDRNGGNTTIRSSSSVNHTLYTFQACCHTGIGLQYLSTSSESNCWITWGYDTPPVEKTGTVSSSNNNTSSPIVKLWMLNNNKVETTPTTDSSLTADAVSQQQQQQQPVPSFDDSLTSRQSTPPTYRLIGHCTSSSNEYTIACARVCPSPIEDSFITVSLPKNPLSTTNNNDAMINNNNSWRVDLWKIKLPSSNQNNNAMDDGNDEDSSIIIQRPLDNMVEKIVTFRGPNDDDDDDDNNNHSNDPNPTSNQLASVLGKNMYTKLGSLCAAEVAVSSYSSSAYHHRQQQQQPRHRHPSTRDGSSTNDYYHEEDNNNNNEDEIKSSSADYGLVLCCLSESGFLTAHAIPEALPDTKARKEISKGRHPTTIKEVKIGATERVLSNSSSSRNHAPALTTKIFPAEQPEVAVSDAARLWNRSGRNNMNDNKLGTGGAESSTALVFPPSSNFTSLNSNNSNNNTNNIESRSLGQPYQQSRDIKISSVPDAVGGGGTMTQFDLDVAPYGLTNMSVSGIHDLGLGPSANQLPASAVSAEEDYEKTDASEKDARDAALLMERIETDRIPCPRLCGASFGPGVGRFVAFHNGDVRKMWHWWQRTDPSRLVGIPGMIGEPSMNDVMKNQKNAESTDLSDDQIVMTPDAPKTQPCPRTFKDLTDMIAAAKEAQWGEKESEASSVGVPIFGDNLFEDDSSSGSNSLAEEPQKQQPPQASDGVSRNEKQMYDNYFRDHHRPLADPISASEYTAFNFSETSDMPNKVSEPALGPTSDMLTPQVKISDQYDQLFLNTQSIYLAKEWKLGDMMIANSLPFINSDTGLDTEDSSERRYEQASQSQNRDLASHRQLEAREAFPSERIHSDPSLSKKQPITEDILTKSRSSGNFFLQEDSERGEYGGEYIQRRNKQDSLVFLEKLFTHQKMQQSQHVTPSLQSHLTPPDRPMHIISKNGSPRNKKDQIKKSINHDGSLQLVENKGGKESIRHGVYALRLENDGPLFSQTQKAKESEDFENRILRMKETCIHNGKVCSSLGEHEKQEVWELLAEVVQSQAVHSKNEYDGWGGFTYGTGLNALGSSLVDNILRFYESLGDVQMLATIVSVLRIGSVGGKHLDVADVNDKDGARVSLLLPEQDERYDTYIRRYADLLYGWGLLSLRAELNKHLARTVIFVDECHWAPDGMTTDVDNLPGVALVFKCPRCGGNTEFGSNFCRHCQDYAFRCAVCDSAVRGLFTICDLCGHGGHVEHVRDWFSQNNVCPTGCGCNCRLSSSSASKREGFAACTFGTVGPTETSRQ